MVRKRRIGVTVFLALIPMILCRSASLSNDSENMQYNLENADDVKPKSRESHLRFYLKPTRDLSMLLYENEVLECQAGGSPPPQMHWLKDGKAIESIDIEDESNLEEYDAENLGESSLGISSTSIRLFLNCVTPQDSGIYTCVGETPYSRISTQVHLTVGSTNMNESAKVCQKQTVNRSPRIIMWSKKRLEYMGGKVRLYCRSDGTPKPIVEWTDNKGNAIKGSHKYKILPNGDLVISKLKWNDMGNYACISKNVAGFDRVETFLYPTRPGK